MAESGNLTDSLAAMGLIELALAFAGIGGYALALNPSLGTRGRLRAAAAAMVAACGFVAMTRPWVNGFILAVLAVAGVGIFTATVWAVSVACGLTAAVPPSDGDAVESPLAGTGTSDSLSTANRPDADVQPDGRTPRANPGSPAHSG